MVEARLKLGGGNRFAEYVVLQNRQLFVDRSGAPSAPGGPTRGRATQREGGGIKNEL